MMELYKGHKIIRVQDIPEWDGWITKINGKDVACDDLKQIKVIIDSSVERDK